MNNQEAFKRLAALIRDSRERMGMTYREYGALFGDLNPSISNIEKMRYANLPSHRTLVKLAEILRIPYWKLIRYLEVGNEDELESLYAEDLTKSEINTQIRKVSDIHSIQDIVSTAVQQMDRIRRQD